MVLLRKVVALIRQKFINRAEGKIHVLIVGAGGAGVQLVKEMVMIEKPKYVPVCIVDDDPKKQGEYVSGIKIAGAISDVKSLCDKYDVHEIFISIPSASKKLLAEIVNKCKSTGRVVKTLPDVSEIANGKVTI
jgi:FlaA1/EpsC-like NDP-sugar epimerase